MDICTNLKHVVPTETYVTKCQCGEKVIMRRYIAFAEGASVDSEPIDKQFLAICKCGNIFLDVK